jgi:hypothetical protein
MRVTGGLVQEQILDHHAFHRSQSGRHVLRIGIGLQDVLALNIDAFKAAFTSGVQHIRNAQSRLVLQRYVPSLFE